MDELIDSVNKRLAFWACVHFVFGILALGFIWVMVLFTVLYLRNYEDYIFYANWITAAIFICGMIFQIKRWSKNWKSDSLSTSRIVGVSYNARSSSVGFISNQILFAGTEHIYRGMDKLFRRLFLSEEEKREAAFIIHQLQQLGTKPRFHPTSDMDRAMLQKLINADIVWFKLDEHEKERVGLNRKYDRSVLI